MKFPMQWHEERHRNQMEHLRREREALERVMVRVAQVEADAHKYGRQIAEAKRRGLDGFDRERFMKAKAGRSVRLRPSDKTGG